MREIDISLKIGESDVILPKSNELVRIGDLTALKKDSNSNFYRSNYKRGELLYSLITQYKPKTIVEFGTGRGYGALCMAKAIIDSNLDSYIYTIDYRNDTDKQIWPIDFGNNPKIIEASIKEIWSQFLPKELIDKIKLLTGTSEKIIENWETYNLPAPDFGFIDGGHDYHTVKHDFYGMLSIANSHFKVLFDDYVAKPEFGICKLIEEIVEPIFNVELINSYSKYHPIHNRDDNHSNTSMVLIDSANTSKSLHTALPKTKIQFFLNDYRKKRKFRRKTKLFRQLLKIMLNRLKNLK